MDFDSKFIFSDNKCPHFPFRGVGVAQRGQCHPFSFLFYSFSLTGGFPKFQLLPRECQLLYQPRGRLCCPSVHNHQSKHICTMYIKVYIYQSIHICTCIHRKKVPKFGFNLKEVDIGLVDWRFKVTLSDRPNIRSHFPSQQNSDGFTFNSVPASEERVAVWPAKGNWIISHLLHFHRVSIHQLHSKN